MNVLKVYGYILSVDYKLLLTWEYLCYEISSPTSNNVFRIDFKYQFHDPTTNKRFAIQFTLQRRYYLYCNSIAVVVDDVSSPLLSPRLSVTSYTIVATIVVVLILKLWILAIQQLKYQYVQSGMYFWNEKMHMYNKNTD